MSVLRQKIASESAAAPIRQRQSAVVQRLRCALPYSLDDALPWESSLWLGVLASAIRDLRVEPIRGGEFSAHTKPAGESAGTHLSIMQSAVDYLSLDPIPAADLLGLDSDYVRRLLRDYQLWPEGSVQGDTRAHLRHLSPSASPALSPMRDTREAAR